MGSISAMNSIDRVIEAHGDEIRAEFAASVPDIIREQFSHVALENGLYHVSVTWVFKGGDMLAGPDVDIDTLGEKYPDCEVAY